jgi:hypothetical protein
LPAPDDGTQPALALPAYRALADAVQAALTRRDAMAVVADATIIDAAVNPAVIPTGLSFVNGATATNGNPAVEQGIVIGVVIEGGNLKVWHNFTGGGGRQINWMAWGAR